MAFPDRFHVMAAALGVAFVAGLTSCGALLCGREAEREFREGCPCMPGEPAWEDGGSAGAVDEGCGRKAELRCTCGVAPEEGEGQGESTGTTGEAVCDAEAPVTLYLSADDSNSMSSPVQARAAAFGEFSSITAVPIRPWEFFNYYDFDYPAAPTGEVRVTAELAAVRDEVDRFALQIAVSSAALPKEDRPPVSLTLVLDTSGSMEGEPLSLLQEVCRAVAANLRAGDTISVVTWNSDNTVVLDGHAAAGPNDPKLLAAIDAVQSGGSTDFHGGLKKGYEVAAKSTQPGRVSRVIMISDGGANTGVTDIDLIAAYAGAENADGIYMVGVGVGSASSYRDTLMDDVTDAGKGASVFIPDAQEAWRMFDERFVETLLVAARDVQVRVEMPPGFAIEKFSGEEYSSDPAEIEPQHLAPGDAMVFHQRLSTCAPELVGPDSQLIVTARYLDAVTFEPREVSVTRSFEELFADASPRLKKGAALLAYTDALTALRVASPDAEAKIAAALEALDAADAALPGDLVLAEIRDVLELL